jgi:O-acetylhomoserine (thiol)-lyase
MANARVVAAALSNHPGVAWLRWAGLTDNPYHERARKYLPLGPGSVFSFGVVGGRAGGRAFIEALELCSHLANIGDTKTLVIHPASTTHRQLSDEALDAAGAADLIRISVGIEDPDDIIWDVECALDTAIKAVQ